MIKIDEINNTIKEDKQLIIISTKDISRGHHTFGELGIATYHIKLQYWDLFDVPELERAPKYDNYVNEKF